MNIELTDAPINIDVSKAFEALTKLASDLKPTKQRRIRPTVAFLKSVAVWMIAQGFANCTLSQAWQVWKAINTYSEQCRIENQQNAELAYWFNVDPFALDEGQRLGLIQNLPSMQCRERIQNGSFSSDDYKGIYELFLCAFGDEDLAQKMQTEAFKAYVEKCTKLGKGV